MKTVTDVVKEVLINCRKPRTIRELMDMGKLSFDEYKGIASIMVGYAHRGLVEKHEKRRCEVSGRPAYTFTATELLKWIHARKEKERKRKESEVQLSGAA